MPNSKKNIFWSEKIPTVNRAFFIVSALLVLGFGFGSILYQLFFVAFVVLLFIDNYVFRRMLERAPSSKLDLWIFRFSIIRNSIFILTFIDIVFIWGLIANNQFLFDLSPTLGKLNGIIILFLLAFGVPVFILITLIHIILVGIRLKKLNKPTKFNFFDSLFDM